ncbi:oxidoreductase [Paenibacillus tarimensis]|uniref:oxidoreductase n=1 Tax=Paenibacillus tarimensis TaxID=416012 RepID=UPI001F17EB7C|nr:oxidoreductase [Paenibacillus tarimensis]MCF2945121.1 oxidoreductase [Paenibacillus tarimensis]
MEHFRALVIERTEGGVTAGIKNMREEQLPEGGVLVRVMYSSVNYKDALACSPGGRIVKEYPFIPGIDAAGIVVESASPKFQPGDEVFATGYELGVSHYGGYSEYARMPAEWLLHRLEGLTLQETMLLGTAGFTAAMSVAALQDSGIQPDSGPVLVTGASGGVGSIAVAILAKLGYEVTAATGKADMHELLSQLGAARIASREELLEGAGKPLNRQVWAGAVDCVGGPVLANVLSRMQYGGAVAASGLTAGTELPATVLPFILRGVRLLGIDSVYAPAELRERLWTWLGSTYKPDGLALMSSRIKLEQIPDITAAMLRGESRGRVVVEIGGSGQ